MGITNNKAVNELFGNRLIYNSDVIRALEEGVEFERYSTNLPKLVELMEYVRDNHTYVHRVGNMITFINNHTGFKM